MSTRKPAGVSRMTTFMVSPEFIKNALVGSGVNFKSEPFSGFAASCATPFLVMNAKFTGSSPALFLQSSLLNCVRLSERLSILSAAHHLKASQLLPGGQSTQPGG